MGEQGILILYSNEKFAGEIEYTFKVLFSILDLPYKILTYSSYSSEVTNTLVVSYGNQKPSVPGEVRLIHIYASDFFGDDYLTQTSLPGRPLPRFDDLPVIYSGNGKLNSLLDKSDNLIKTNIDIIASSFFMLTRYEEVIVDERDKFDRFPATSSLAYKEGFLERPIVDEYIELFWNWIDSFNPGLKRKKLWAGKKFAVCLTHDVDRLRKFRLMPPLLTLKRVLFERRESKKAWRVFTDYLKAIGRSMEDPYLIAFDRLLSLERAYGCASTFYFMAEGEDYSVSSSDTKALMNRLLDERNEIGLHGGFDSYNDSTRLNDEKRLVEQALGAEVIGIRQHFLRWKTPETWRIQEKAGLKYDTTLSFADHVGFRCGICHPYQPFDVLEGRILDIWEVPLVVMDGSLFGYQDLCLEEGWQVIKTLIDTVEQHRGVFVTLWHNSSFYELEHPGRLDLYRGMLGYVASKDALRSTVLETLGTWQTPAI